MIPESNGPSRGLSTVLHPGLSCSSATSKLGRVHSTPRIAVLVAALLWLTGVGILVVNPAASTIALALIGSSTLAAVGAALLGLRVVARRISDTRAAMAELQRGVTNLARTAPPPSSATDWTPMRAVDAPTVAAIIALTSRLDLTAVSRVGTVDHAALADVIAVVDEERPTSIVVYGAPAEALAIALAGEESTSVVAVVADEPTAERVSRLLAHLGAVGRVTTVVIEFSAGSDASGWPAEALENVPDAALTYLAGPPWSLGADSRRGIVERVVDGPATHTVVVPEPRRLEAQGVVRQLIDGGFQVTRESHATVVLRRTSST